MMNYCLVNMFEEPIRAYHWNLVEEVAKKFPSLTWTKEQRLAAHFTVKYSFESSDVFQVENIIAEFTKTHAMAPVKTGGFDHFGDQVVFAKIDSSQEARTLFEELIYELKKISWMQWNEFDGPDLSFHMTIAQKCGEFYQDVLTFLKGKEQYLDSSFSNITILKYEATQRGANLWKPYKSFPMK